MASRVAIGIMRESAVKTLDSAMHELFGEGFILPTQGRDPDLLHAQQLETIATFLQCKADEKRQVAEYTLPEGAEATTVAVGSEVVKSSRKVRK